MGSQGGFFSVLTLCLSFQTSHAPEEFDFFTKSVSRKLHDECIKEDIMDFLNGLLIDVWYVHGKDTVFVSDDRMLCSYFRIKKDERTDQKYWYHYGRFDELPNLSLGRDQMEMEKDPNSCIIILKDEQKSFKIYPMFLDRKNGVFAYVKSSFSKHEHLHFFYKEWFSFIAVKEENYKKDKLNELKPVFEKAEKKFMDMQMHCITRNAKWYEPPCWVVENTQTFVTLATAQLQDKLP